MSSLLRSSFLLTKLKHASGRWYPAGFLDRGQLRRPGSAIALQQLDLTVPFATTTFDGHVEDGEANEKTRVGG